jgi:hypothetical protein
MIKGASAFVGWYNSVGSWFTDIRQRIFYHRWSMGPSLVRLWQSEGGPDPVYNGRLSFLDPATVSHDCFDDAISTFGEWTILRSVTLVVAEKLVKKR